MELKATHCSVDIPMRGISKEYASPLAIEIPMRREV